MAKVPSRSAALPAPVGGWDTREALADMPDKNAIILDNFFPSTDKVTLRKGHAEHATGMSGAVETLIKHVANSGTEKMFAVNDGNIYDVSSSGAVGAAVVTGLSNDRFQQALMSTGGGQYAFICNGADTPRTYDGTTWANSAISGPTIANLIWCNVYQNRLWVGEKDSLKAWYLGVDAVNGGATSLNVPAKRGGYLMGMGTWTFDGDQGSAGDNAAVFLTSEGEAIVYKGSYPGASDWEYVGSYLRGKPIGRRCMIQAGGDLVMLLQDGLIPASALMLDRSQSDKGAISAQINKAVNDAVRDYSSLFGWEPFLYPAGTMLLLNVPQTSTTAHQYVFNTITGAPCRFKSINALCFALMGDDAYFGGSDGKVYKFDTGYDDNGNNIEGDALQAFSYFGSKGTVKAFKRVQPIFESNGDPEAALDLNVDFQVKNPTGVSGSTPTSAGKWGIAKWGSGLWGTSKQIFKAWRGVRGYGRAASLRVRIDTKTVRPSWVATDYLYVPGGQV